MIDALKAAALLLALPATFPAYAQPAPAPSANEATFDDSRQFDFVSKINGESYRIQVAVPRGTSLDSSYPVLYVLDGNIFFGTFAAAAKRRVLAGELGKFIVVGIASKEGPREADRDLDFTWTQMPARERKMGLEFPADQVFAGGENFLRVIREEVEPKVNAIVPIDPRHRTIFGWSLGGLFVVRTMLAHPEAFNCYLAISPSLYFAEREALQRVPDLKNSLLTQKSFPRVFIGVGQYEQDPSVNLFQGSMHDTWAHEINYARMVDNAKDMHDALAPILHDDSNNIFHVYNDTHTSAPWTALNPMLNFAFGEGVFGRKAAW